MAIKIDIANTIATFLFENIITRFGCPKELISHQKIHFINSMIAALMDKYEIKHQKIIPYDLWTNG